MREKQIDEIGTVLFRKSKRAKHVNITVKPFKDVVVSVPENTTYKVAENILREHTDWVQREQEKMRSHESQYTWFELDRSYQFKDISVEVISSSTAGVESTMKGKKLIVLIPHEVDIDSSAVQEAIRAEIEQVIKSRAKEVLPQLARTLAEKHHVPVQKIYIRRATTRWGSCSPKNNLSLSYFLYLLPDHLIEYAILHELAHVKIKDHSKAYWLHLESMIPNAKRLDREIKSREVGVV
jgi:predicted metal-dependent hydrolase